MSEAWPLPPGSRVIGYLRVSGETQKGKGTIAGQLQELERYVQGNGLILVHPPFVDEAKPGSSTAPRDGFNSMINYAHQEPRPCDGIIFWSWSRFSRDRDDAHFFKADLRRRGYVLVSLSDDMPHADGLEYVLESMVHWKDQQYLEQLSRDTKRGLHLLARHGYAPGGFPPRGYKAEHLEVEIAGKKRSVARWVPDAEWAPRVLEAWQMRANGASYQEIIDKTGIYSSRDSLITHFRNKTYLGYRICGEIEVPDAHEPLVSVELFDAVQQTLYERPKRGETWTAARHPRRYNSPHLLSGFVRCAYCGGALVGRTCNTGRHRNWRYYACGTKNRKGWKSCPSRTIPAEHLESAVVGMVMDKLLTYDFVTSLVDEVNSALNTRSSSTQMTQVENRIKTLDRAIMKLVDVAEEVEDTTEVVSRLRQRKEEGERLRGELRVLESSHEVIEVPRHIVEEILAEMRQPLANGTLDAQRTVLQSAVDRIVVGKKKAELYYQFPCAHLYKVPPGECEQQDRTVSWRSPSDTSIGRCPSDLASLGAVCALWEPART